MESVEVPEADTVSIVICAIASFSQNVQPLSRHSILSPSTTHSFLNSTNDSSIHETLRVHSVETMYPLVVHRNYAPSDDDPPRVYVKRVISVSSPLNALIFVF